MTGDVELTEDDRYAFGGPDHADEVDAATLRFIHAVNELAPGPDE